MPAMEAFTFCVLGGIYISNSLRSSFGIVRLPSMVTIYCPAMVMTCYPTMVTIYCPAMVMTYCLTMVTIYGPSKLFGISKFIPNKLD